jgi:hypothetical protein
MRARWRLGSLAVLVVCIPLLAAAPVAAKPKLRDAKPDTVKIKPRLAAQLAGNRRDALHKHQGRPDVLRLVRRLGLQPGRS